MSRRFFGLLLVVAFVVVAHSVTVAAGEFNPTLKIGDAAPNWKDLPGADGKTHSLSDWKDKPALVIVFTCNSCPVAVDYEDRIIEIARRHADQVGFVAINVSRAEADDMTKMKERHAEKKFPYPYVADSSQEVGKAYGATGTPEFFVLSAERKIVYMGALDDNADAGQVKERYLEPALEAVLAGKAPAPAETYAHGCRIRYQRQRSK